nr:uncharacterized protein LOC109169591 isoform X1 [Ipomoea batatas]GMD48738.1 uncharacterized protein LOC109169591 isoform X1 [Ipomoea batatas]
MEECFERKPLCSVFRCLRENLRALFVLMMRNLKESCRNLFKSRDCFGCCTKSPFVISSEKRSRALKNQGREATKKSLGGEFWSSSTGFLLWNQIRQQWVGNRETKKRAAVDEPKLSFDATYDSLLGTNKPFPQPIPLSEMVDFLVDVWEQDGLYD